MCLTLAGIILEYDLNEVPLQKSIDLLDLSTETEVEARAPKGSSVLASPSHAAATETPLLVDYGHLQSLLDDIIQYEPMVKEAHKGPLRKLIYKLQVISHTVTRLFRDWRARSSTIANALPWTMLSTPRRIAGWLPPCNQSPARVTVAVERIQPCWLTSHAPAYTSIAPSLRAGPERRVLSRALHSILPTCNCSAIPA